MTRIIFSFLLFALLFVTVSCSAVPVPGSDKAVTSSETEYAGQKITLKSSSAGEALDYFAEIAFGSEYGESSDRLCRFEEEIVCSLSGKYTDEDTELIDYLFETLNQIDGFPGIRFAKEGQSVNFEILFVPRSEIMEMFSDADEFCVGMSEYHWYTESYRIFKARAAIDCDEVAERASTICEEILQSLGLAMDSYSHPDSVFYQGTCYYRRPSELDFALVKILYSPHLRTGMDKDSAMVAAAGILTWK